jgi:large subunit ribosomal protein L4
MSKLPIKDMQGQHVGERDVADTLLVFDKGGQALHDAVVMRNANRRGGNASTLTKGEVQGTGSKPWRQKGLGRARAGYRRAPHWRGGGVVFGPKPRSYRKSMTKKAARLAFRRAFSEKVAAGQVTVLDQLALSEPKTRLLAALVQSLELKGLVLLLTAEQDERVKMAARNMAGLQLMHVGEVCTYDLLRYPNILITRQAVDAVEQRLQNAEGRAS